MMGNVADGFNRPASGADGFNRPERKITNVSGGRQLVLANKFGE